MKTYWQILPIYLIPVSTLRGFSPPLPNRHKKSCRNKILLSTLCVCHVEISVWGENCKQHCAFIFPPPHWHKLGTYWLSVTYTKTSPFPSTSNLSSSRSQYDLPALDSHTLMCGFKHHQSHQTCKSQCDYWCLDGEKWKNSCLLRDVFVLILNVCFCSKPSSLSAAC